MTSGPGAAEATPLRYQKILVTGGTGFVGNYLVDALRSRLLPQAELVVGGRGEAHTDVVLDLFDPGTIRRAVEMVKPDLVLHLAGEASVASAAENSAQAWRLNVGGTMALAQAIADVSPHCTVFFTSSAEVYGDAFLLGRVCETTRALPVSVYGETKLAAERALAALLPTEARLLIVRPSNHIGPGQSERFALSSFARQLAESERRNQSARIVVGNLEPQRDFMDVRDVVRAYVDLLGFPLAAGARETFNISSGVLRTVGSLLNMMRASSTVVSSVVVDPARYRSADIPAANVDSAKVRRLIHWKPALSIEQSVIDIFEGWRGIVDQSSEAASYHD